MSLIIDIDELTARFMRYVQVDTQSDPGSSTFPTTQKQKDLSVILVKELKELGIVDAALDTHGYVYATIPANTNKKVPVICFCAHVDTAPDCSGTNVKPILHKNYQGQDIILPDDSSQVITVKDYPYLREKMGDDIITASGLTLLGSDDKSGVAIIMQLATVLMKNDSIKHGTIKLLFTPDEEVGKGTANVDLKKLGADFGFTLDGGELGSLEDETFSADGVKVIVSGVIAHPGYAKDKLVNALKIAGEILAELPKHELSPETTSGKDGFFHPVGVDGIAEKCTLEFIVRDFDTAGLAVKEAKLKSIVDQVLKRHPKASYEFKVKEQYRNMKEVLDKKPEIVQLAKDAIAKAGLNIRMESIRGGTDGSRLSFMGLPCPNIFTGMQAIHSRHEFVSAQDMQKSVEVLLNLVALCEERS